MGLWNARHALDCETMSILNIGLKMIDFIFDTHSYMTSV